MNIFDIQRHLRALGHDPGPIDGIYGGRTRAGIHAAIGGRAAAGWERWGEARLLVAAEQAIMRAHGVDTGPIDGLVGPQTLHARTLFAARNWRDTLVRPEPEDVRFPAPVRNTWPRQADCIRHFGNPGENQTMLALPFAMRLAWDTSATIARFSIHEKVHDSAARIFRRIHEHYGDDRIPALGLDLFGGCLNVRPMRGGSSLSTHSWGIAIDLDPSHNQLSWGRDRARLARPEYERFWDFWTEEGWLSLGKARNFDWMHVQAAQL